MYSHVIPELREARPWEKQSWVDATYFLVAALFAGHRWSREHDIDHPPPNLGASFREFVRAAERDNRPVSESTEKRFAALLECDRNELPDHLRYAANLLDDTPIDWLALLTDIGRWDAEKRTQLQWAKTYWYRPPKKPADDESPTGQANDDDDDKGADALAEEGAV
jgi:CRISPR type I-E-associated protein CasB/Cse2